jgi:hypothetical protein
LTTPREASFFRAAIALKATNRRATMSNVNRRPPARNADYTVVAAVVCAAARRRVVLQNAPLPARANSAFTITQ